MGSGVHSSFYPFTANPVMTDLQSKYGARRGRGDLQYDFLQEEMEIGKLDQSSHPSLPSVLTEYTQSSWLLKG